MSKAKRSQGSKMSEGRGTGVGVADHDGMESLVGANPTSEMGEWDIMPDTDFNPELAEILYRSLASWMTLDNDRLDAQLSELEANYGPALYSELIYLLSHLRFSGEVARGYWQEICQLRAQMRERLGSFVDVRIALAAYFVQVNRKLQNPKIIELQLFEQTRSYAYRDELTGLPNYRFFAESIDREILRSRRSNQPLSIVMVDVDNFKDYNDRHGHEAGNVVLTEVARLLSFALREEDMVARYGGEEFALILPGTPKAGAMLVAERARAGIEARDIPHEGNHPTGRVTVSMGIATCPGDASQASAMIRCADRALYSAKTNGKNQIQLYGQNRRSFTRIQVKLEGRFRTFAKEQHTMTTLNISEGGIRFKTREDLPEGTLLDFEMDLPNRAGRIQAIGRVVGVMAGKDGSSELSVRIVSLETEDRLMLHRYLGDHRERNATKGEQNSV